MSHWAHTAHPRPGTRRPRGVLNDEFHSVGLTWTCHARCANFAASLAFQATAASGSVALARPWQTSVPVKVLPAQARPEAAPELSPEADAVP